jgi:hypothetical protein
VEVKVIDRATGLQVSSQNAWGMALGRTEDDAGRKALEQAGRFVAAYAGGQVEGWAQQHGSSAQTAESKDGKPEEPGDQMR